MNILYIIIGIFIVWTLWSYFSSRVESAVYSVLEKKQGYEIRLYPAHIVAETTVEGTYSEALNQGFRIVARYIFGGNTRKESITMTTPVIEQKISEPIAMTSPVMASIGSNMRTIAFGMPKSYTLETLPTPNDPRVKIVTVPEKKMAATRFTWSRSSARVEIKKLELLSALKRDNLETVGEPQYAGYSAPWTAPWMTRNEVLIEVK